MAETIAMMIRRKCHQLNNHNNNRCILRTSDASDNDMPLLLDGDDKDNGINIHEKW